MLPLISIIIPIYNIEQFLKKCLDSILSQTYPNYEVLLINDGSTDTSEVICKEYVNKYNKFQLYTKENNGVSSARNEGIKKARGKYLVFIDGDDYIEKNYIEMLYKPFNGYDIDLSVCGYIKENINGDIIYKIDDKDNYLSERRATILSLFGKDKYYRYQGYIYNKLYKKSIIDKYDIKFDNEIFFNEDRLFVFQYTLHINKAYYTTTPLYHYIIHNNSAVFSAIKSTTSINKYLTFIDAFIIMDNNRSEEQSSFRFDTNI